MSILKILDRILIRERSVIKESPRSFKVYLPMEYNNLFEEIRNQGMLVDVIIFLPRECYGVDKVLSRNRYLVREKERFKLYLPKAYNNIWEELKGEKVDLLLVIR